MTGQMEGYVYLSRREEQKAREFFGRHGRQIPDMDEGDSIGGKPIVCGLEEHPITGRLVIPRQMPTRRLMDIALQAAGLTDREWRIWELHCRGNSQGHISAKLGINKSNVCRSLRSIESKIVTARERAQKALRGHGVQISRRPNSDSAEPLPSESSACDTPAADLRSNSA